MKNGFTLIELVIVLMIVCILFSIAIGHFAGGNSLNEAYVRECILEKELTVDECQVNADVLYPKEQSQSVKSGTPVPTR